MGKSIYTTILARYAGFPERLLQWYVNGRPVRQANTVFDVKYDGLNTYLRYKHDDNQTYGTFMLKVNGTKWKDILNMPQSKQISSFIGSSKTFLTKIVTKVVNGHLLSDIKSTPFSKSDTLSNEFSSQTNYKPTNRKFLPETIRLGQDKKQKSKQRGHYVSQDSISSPLQQTDSWISDRNYMKSFDPSSPTTPLSISKLIPQSIH